LNSKDKKMPLAKLRLKGLPLSKPKPNAKPPLRRKLDVKLKLKPNVQLSKLPLKLLAKPKLTVLLKLLPSKLLKSSKLAPPRKQPLPSKPLPVSKPKLRLMPLPSKLLRKPPAMLMTVLPNAQIYSKMVIFRNN
jgi:hypothetical protein